MFLSYEDSPTRVRQRGARVIARGNGGGGHILRHVRGIDSLVMLTSVAILLAGCTGSPFASRTASVPHDRPPSTIGPGPGLNQKPGPQENKGENWAAVAHPKPPPPSVEPRSVVGATEGEAMKLLGAPSMIADRAPALVWEYHGQKCALSLHFYMDVNTQTYHVLTYDIAPKSVAESSCFASIRSGGS